MNSKNVPAWLKGCKLMQFVDDRGRYVTCIKLGKQVMPFSYSDEKNGWLKHAEWCARSFAEALGITFTLKEMVVMLRRRLVRTWKI